MTSDFLELLRGVLDAAGGRQVELLRSGDIELRFRAPTDGEINRELYREVEGSTQEALRASGFDDLEQGVEEARARKEIEDARKEALGLDNSEVPMTRHRV